MILKAPLRFALVGVLNTFVDVALFTTLSAALGLVPAWANIPSYGAGVLVSFLLNRRWTFRKRGGAPAAVMAEFSRFMAINLAGLLLSTALVAAFALMMPPLAAKVLSLPVSFAWNFLLSRGFVFHVADRSRLGGEEFHGSARAARQQRTQLIGGGERR
jgi:putative flippase GtrA